MVWLPKFIKYFYASGLFILFSIICVSTINAQESESPFQLPDGSGALFIGGGIEGRHGEILAIKEFFRLSGGDNAKILIIAFGYSSLEDAEITVSKYTNLLSITADTIILLPDMELSQPLEIEYSGIILLGEEHTPINTEILSPIRDAWLSGIPIFADRTGSAIFGPTYTVSTQVQGVQDSSTEPNQSISNIVEIVPGLKMLEFAIETQILSDDHWVRYNALSSANPELIVVGIPNNTFLNLTQQKVYVSGDSDVFVYGLSSNSEISDAENDSLPSNRIIDVFSPGAEIDIVYQDKLAVVNTPIPTPLPVTTETPQPSSTSLPATEMPEENSKKPTKTPKPTMTPPTIPPSQNVSQTNFMILFVVLAAIVVVVGVWINRERKS